MDFNRILPRLCCGALGAFAIMFSAVSASAYDFSAKTGNGTDIFYNINPDGKTVTVTYGGSKYNVSSLEIPQEVSHDGVTYTVTAIGNKAFQEAKVNTITLPNTITEFQSYAFCLSSIREFNYPSNLKYIRSRVFDGTQINNGDLPEGLETIEEGAFARTRIKELYLPPTLTTIESMAFYGCDYISEVAIPGSVRIISRSAFSNCRSLSKVTFGEGVEELEGACFEYTPLSEIEIPSSVTILGQSCFAGNKIKELILPNTIRSIGESCFYSSSELESITFSSGLTELPASVCKDCNNLYKINIPEGITKIGIYAFENCRTLSHITLPQSLTELGDRVFSGSGIVDFVLPPNVKTINARLFEYCDNLTDVTVTSNISRIEEHAFANCNHIRNVLLPDKLEYLDEYAFSGCSSLETINIPSSLTSLRHATFWGCTKLRKLQIPEGVKELQLYLFQGCVTLEELELPKSLEKIDNGFIDGCESLKKLVLYNNVDMVAQGAFNGCPSLQEIHLYRAVLPTCRQATSTVQPVIPADNNCTLYVPVGSVESYKASEYWNTFKNIVGEEISEPLNYQISFPWSISGGKLTVNGEATKNVMEFAMDSDVEIVAVPNTGYHLQALLVNGEDVTAAMTDGRYIISKIASNYTVDAKFAENPVKLSLFMAVGGSVDVDVEKKDTFSCTITPEKGWEINTVTFNGRNVTADLTDDNRYTTPALTGDSELRVTFENRDSAVKNIGIDATATKVYVDRDGVVTLEGLEPGVLINVYTVSGQFVNSATSNSGVTTMQLQQHGIYIIQTPAQTFKLQY